MTIFHMNCDEARDVAWELNQMINRLHGELQTVVVAANTLEVVWPDNEPKTLITELQAILTRLKETAAAGDDLSVSLNKTVAQWETWDQEGAANIQGTSMPVASASPISQTAAANAPPSEKQPDTNNAEAPVESPVSGGSEAVQPGTAVTSGRWQQLSNWNEINSDIKNLESRFSQLTPEEADRLNELQEQRRQMRQMFSDGIPEKAGINNFPEGQCTWYVATRRELDVYGDARLWGDKAIEAGYEVGSMPVKGSVMVWQPGVNGANADYGHVSLVERVIPESDGSFTVYYTDNDNMDPASPLRVSIRPGEEGIQFIYDRT